MQLHEIQKACILSNMNVEGMIILDLHCSPYWGAQEMISQEES